MRNLLDLVVVLVLLTGLQAILAGIIAVRLPALRSLDATAALHLSWRPGQCWYLGVPGVTGHLCRALQSRRRAPLLIWWHFGSWGCRSVRSLHVVRFEVHSDLQLCWLILPCTVCHSRRSLPRIWPPRRGVGSGRPTWRPDSWSIHSGESCHCNLLALLASAIQ